VSEALLVDGVVAGYGALTVLWDVSFAVAEGETVVLLGPNGAGKTTLLKALVGLLPLRRGRIRLVGEPLEHLPPDARVRRGLAFMSEVGAFLELTVAENLQVAGAALGRREFQRRLDEVLALFPDLRRLYRLPAGSLSGGQRKMLAVAKAILRPPKVLLMDEPSSGLSPKFVRDVFAILSRLAELGTTMLVAEQNVGFLTFARKAVVLEGGRVAFSGGVAELRRHPSLMRAYFGVEGMGAEPRADSASLAGGESRSDSDDDADEA